MNGSLWNTRGHGSVHSLLGGSVCSIAFDPEVELLWVGEQYGTLSSFTVLPQNDSQTFNTYSCFHATDRTPPRQIGFLGTGANTLVTVAEREAIRGYKRGGVAVMYLPVPPETQPSISCFQVSQEENTVYFTGSRGLTQMKLTDDGAPAAVSVPYDNTIETLSIHRSYVATGTTSGSVMVRDTRDINTVVAQISACRSTVQATELFDHTLLVGYSDRTSPCVKVYDIRQPKEPLHTSPLPAVSDLSPSNAVLSIQHFQDNFCSMSHQAFVLTSQSMYLMLLDNEPDGPSFLPSALDAKSTCMAVSPSNTCAAVGTETGYFVTYGHPLTRPGFIMSSAEQPPRPTAPNYRISWAEIKANNGFDESVPEHELASSWPEPNYMILAVPQKLHCVDKEVPVPRLQRSDSYLPDRKDNLAARVPNPYPYNTLLGEDPAKAHEILLELRREHKRRMKIPSRSNGAGHDDYYGMLDSPMNLYNSSQKNPWRIWNEIPHKMVGVDNSYPECWVSALLQCLYLCQAPEFPIRKVILRHLCSREYCVTCEISFIFSNMLVTASSQHSKESALPPIVQISHLLRTMAQLPAFQGIFEKPRYRDEAVAKMHACQRELLKRLHRDLQDQRDYPFMNYAPPSEDFGESIATYFGTEFKSSTSHKIEPRFYWEVPGSALKVDEGLQHLLKEMEHSQENVQITSLPPIIVLLLNPEHSHLKPPNSLKISKNNGEDYNYMLSSNVIHLADDVEDTGNFVVHQRIKEESFSLINDYRVTMPTSQRDLEQMVPALRSYTAVVSYYALCELTAPSYAKSDDNRPRNMWEVLGPLLIHDIFTAPLASLQKNRMSQQFKTPLKSHLEIERDHLIAIDAEYVMLKWGHRFDEFDYPGRKHHMALARVSCILSTRPGDERTILDDYVHTPEVIEDYVTQYSGIRPGDLDSLKSTKALTALKATYLKLRALVDAGVIFVGHGLAQDFRVCNIVVPKRQIIDTLLLFNKAGARYMSLRFLAYHLMGEQVQEEEHDSIEDARTSLRLYRAYQQLQEAGTFDATLDQLLKRGADTNWTVPSVKPTSMSLLEQNLPSSTLNTPA